MNFNEEESEMTTQELKSSLDSVNYTVYLVFFAFIAIALNRNLLNMQKWYFVLFFMRLFKPKKKTDAN